MINQSVIKIGSSDSKIRVCAFVVSGKEFSRCRVNFRNGVLPKFFKNIFLFSRRQRTILENVVWFPLFFIERRAKFKFSTIFTIFATESEIQILNRHQSAGAYLKNWHFFFLKKIK